MLFLFAYGKMFILNKALEQNTKCCKQKWAQREVLRSHDVTKPGVNVTRKATTANIK